MRWTTPCRALALSLVAFLPSAYSLTNAPSQSQDVIQSNQTLRTNTRLVVVDVVATDGKGQPVTDLKASDFALLEDGKPQKISGFNFEHPGGAPAHAVVVNLPPSVVTNAPKFQSNSLNVILFDTVNGDFAEHAYARDQLLKFLNSAELGRPVAIFALQTQLKLLHDFTTDNKALSAAVAKYRPPAQGLTGETAESRASAFATLGDYHTSERGIETTLNQLNALAKVLAGYPGRKNLIWLSESFPLTLYPESMGQANGDGQAMRTGIDPGSSASNLQNVASFKTYAGLIKKVSDALMAAQVAVYPVDAGALGKDDHLAAQHTMDNMAENTGGKSFKNSNDLVLGLRTSIEDGSTYYTLTYYPENKNWDGQFRTIQVKSSRANVSLRYRDGYYAVDPEKMTKEDSDAVAENFSRSLELDAPSATQIIFQAQVQPPSEKNKKVVVTLHIDPRTLAFEQKDGGMEFAHLSCTVWAYGKDKDKPMMSNGTVTANLKASEYQQVVQQRFLPCERQLDLKPGTYALRIGVLDRATNKIGTASAQVVVP
ncbi:MAG TPA: VWA domain-containing protein [Candidatus Binatia bacterium]|nr:VWA domain-containing protein [Candidatus Binatia bacterium]